MCKYSIIRDRDSWNEKISCFSKKDIYFTYEYYTTFSNYGDGVPELFFFESDYGKVAYPYMVRDISHNYNFINILEENKYFDISSVYGYGGPLYETSTVNDALECLRTVFFECFSRYCSERNFVSQFDRFHPFLNNHIFFAGNSNISLNKKTVCIYLDSLDEIWKNINQKCRNRIRAAEKRNVSIVVNDDKKTIEKFVGIYRRTMLRKKADQYYFFNDRFFNETINNLDGNVLIANAYYENEIIMSSIILCYDKFMHCHFSCSLKEYQNCYANNLLLYEVAKWGVKNGYEKFHLGGGYESENDSLYRFKKAFSLSDDFDYYIGRKVYNTDLYDRLTSLRGIELDKYNYFPIYRIDIIENEQLVCS